ncbi:MAG: hypothetical protein ABEJ28_12265, partial [Salinigranum sp.]
SPTLKDAVTANATPGNRGSVVSAMSTLKNAGKVLAPALFGAVLAVAGFGAAFLSMTVVLVCYLAVLVRGTAATI